MSTPQPPHHLADQLRVLLVEDNPGDVRLMQEYLKDGIDGSFELETAADCAAAAKRMAGGNLDVVLVDLQLPDSSGLQTFQRLHQARPDLPIVVMTGLDDRALSRNAVEAGAQDYLVKGQVTGEVVTRVLRYAVSRKRSQDALRQSQQQLLQAQKLEGIGRLAGGIAHDFNNLLTSILGYAQMVMGALDDDSPLREDIQEIVRAGERAALLTRQLLAVGRKQLQQIRRINLNEIVEGMNDLLQRTMGEDIELAARPASQAAMIEADPGQIEQILLNLAVNARDAMPTGGNLTIRVESVALDDAFCEGRTGVEPGTYVLLVVGDNGCGMSKEVQELAFEPFFTTKPPDRGTGLGLSTVYGIVKQSRGFIELTSELGVGTTFHIYFPAATAGLQADVEPAGDTLPRGTETILLVEDEDTVRRLVSRTFKELGYEVLEARDGKRALDICATYEQPIHLVLTDVVMPAMSGPEMVGRMKRIRTDFKVLYMTGFTDDRILHHGVANHGVQVIQKPYTRQTLSQRVRSVLDEK